MQALFASFAPGAVSSVLASGIPGTGGMNGGAAGSAAAERSAGLPGAATGGGAAAETSTGLSGPSGTCQLEAMSAHASPQMPRAIFTHILHCPGVQRRVVLP